MILVIFVLINHFEPMTLRTKANSYPSLNSYLLKFLMHSFNGHSKVWGCLDTIDRGEIIEDVIAENDLCLLNEKQPTYLHPPTGNYYAIDLSLCHPNIYLDFDWSVCDDLHGRAITKTWYRTALG